ncbi:MAG: CapA family protein, partial [Oscillospiraceae bacterium]
QSNNHTYDLGADGLSATKEFWANMPSDVVTAGIYDDETLYNIPTNTINGIKFAYLSYTQFTNGLPTPANSPYYVIYTSQTDIIEKQIKLARETADFVIVSVHWGNEDSHNITQGQTDLAQQFADFGADVIIGTHPHVIQSVSNLISIDGRTVLCAYSLGNFVSAQAKPDQMLGYILKFDAVMNNGKKSIENILVCPTVNHFGNNHSNIQVYMLDDYTEEMALQHGVRSEYPFFNLEYINEVFSTYIPQEFL